MATCMQKLADMGAGVTGAGQLSANVCAPCPRAFYSISQDCGGAGMPTEENLEEAECKDYFCAIVSACPTNPTKSPVPGLELADFNGGLSLITAKVENCEEDASGSYVAGASVAFLLGLGAVVV